MLKSRLLTAIALAILGSACIMAQKVTIDKITYLIENGEASVYKADKDIEVANILSSVEYKGKSYPVTRIGLYNETEWQLHGSAFAYKNGRAFICCEKLSSVSIPNSITFIGSFTFFGCDRLTSVHITDLAAWCNIDFYDFPLFKASLYINGAEVKDLVIPNNVKNIKGSAFKGYDGLTSVTIPNSVTTIGASAFTSSSLKKIIVPDTKINMERNSFSCHQIAEAFCQNGNFPTYMLPYLPEDCPFMLAQRYQQGGNNNNMYAQNVQQQAPQNSPNIIMPQTKRPSSDVDVNLPSNATNNDKTFAIIFANENYQEEVKVDYALNDGEMFKEYCQKVLGLPEDNVHIRKDATLNNIKAEMSWLQKVAEAYNGQARFIVFYAGHGIPDEKTGTSYLLPVDGKGTMLETGYSLKQFYTQLGEMPAAGITVFMDACFSGSKRGDGMLASARGVAIKAKPQAPQGKMVVFSAAQGDETAYPFKEKEHGLFTYYLLKKLQETNGNVSLGELGQFLTEQVSRKSIVANGKSQTPTIVPSGAMTETWRSMKLK